MDNTFPVQNCPSLLIMNGIIKLWTFQFVAFLCNIGLVLPAWPLASGGPCGACSCRYTVHYLVWAAFRYQCFNDIISSIDKSARRQTPWESKRSLLVHYYTAYKCDMFISRLRETQRGMHHSLKYECSVLLKRGYFSATCTPTDTWDTKS